MIGIGKEMLVLDKIISDSMLSVVRLVLLKFRMYLERICLVFDMFCMAGEGVLPLTVMTGLSLAITSLLKFLCCREADVDLDKWCKPMPSVHGYLVEMR